MERPLRALVSGPVPESGRVLYHNLRFRGHNNRRYEALLPRLDRVDAYWLTCSDQRLLRAAQYRALRRARALRHRLLLGTGARRGYRYLLSTDPEQVPYFPGPVVVDVDDPRFSEEELRLLSGPNVAACVFTSERVARRHQELGLEVPVHVVPQGVDLSAVSPARVEELRRLRAGPGCVFGYVAARLVTAGDGDRADRTVYDVDHLLELWSGIRAEAADARLWLVGHATDAARRRATAAGAEVLGPMAPGEALAHVANFDVALYPRTVNRGISPSKVAEYMGLGVPTLSYDLEDVEMVGQAGAGVLVADAREFVAAGAALAADEARRRALATAALAAGKELDWDRLAARYRAEVLDVHLPA